MSNHELFSQIDAELVNLHNTLNVLYAMHGTTRCEDVDLDRYSSATYTVWLNLYEIEERLAELLEKARGNL